MSTVQMNTLSTTCVSAVLLFAGACSSPPRPSWKRTDLLRSLLDSPLKAELDNQMPPAEVAEAEPPQAAPSIAGEQVFALELRGVPLAEALHMIASQAGVNLYLESGLTAWVDADFPAVTLDDALGALLKRNGLRLVEEPRGIYFVERADGSQPAVGEFQLESKGAADVLENLRLLVGGDAIVVADTTHNFVVVRGTQDAVDASRNFLTRVDRLQPQVLVEVHIFEVSLDDRFELGLKTSFGTKINGGPVQILENLGSSSTPFSVRMQDAGNDFDATLDALQSYVGLELVSSPRVLAVTNSEATIEVVEEIPYVETTTVTSGTTSGVGSTTQESVQFKQAGIKLTVKPTIQADGTLLIDIDQSLSEVAEFFNQIPVLDTRRLSSRFMLRDRETVVLGGLMQDRRLKRDSGIPLLMHLPLLGHFFRRDVDETVKRELLLFVTPRILDPQQAASLAPHYQSNFREVRRQLQEGQPEGEGAGADEQSGTGADADEAQGTSEAREGD